MRVATSALSELDPAVLRPEQILGGSPTTRSTTLGVSPDGNLSYNLWDCTAGSFRWFYRSDEIIHVLEGGATITPQGGEPRTVHAGDVVYFERGLVADWVVPSYIKKLAVHRSTEVSLRQRVTGKVRKVLSKVLPFAIGTVGPASLLQQLG
jgi:uncharacterized cupin superfamily protein